MITAKLRLGDNPPCAAIRAYALEISHAAYTGRWLRRFDLRARPRCRFTVWRLFAFYAALRFFEIARVLIRLDYFVVAVWRAKEAESQPT
jgi:hypothetical protein